MPESGLSYQTTMPSYPDVTYQTYASQYGGGRKTRLGQALNAWSQGHPNYETWRQNLLDEYNAGISAYNAWSSSPAGNRQQREEAGYNVNYDPGSVSSGSPLSYQDSNPGSGFSEMAQGVQGALSFADSILNFKAKIASIALDAAMKKAQIKNLDAKTQGTLTENLYKDPYWTAKVLGLNIGNKWNPLLNEGRVNSLRIANQWQPLMYGRQFDALGYQNDKIEMENAAELFSRGYRGSFVSGSGSAYDLNNVGKGLGYQRGFQDIELVKVTRDLKKQEAEVAKFTAKEKEFYVSSIQDVYKEYLETQLGLAKGELTWQGTRQKIEALDYQIREKAFKWHVGLGVANTTVNAIKTGLSFLNPTSRLFNGLGSSPVDLHDYGAYGSY